MNGCRLRLQSKAGPEICGGGQTLKAEFELIEKFIESIFGTSLHTEEGIYELFVSLTQPNKAISLRGSALQPIQSTLTKNFTSTHCS